MSQYDNNPNGNYLSKDRVRTKERERYFNLSRFIPIHRIYETITFTASAASVIIQDAPRAIISTLTTLMIPAGRYLIRKTKQKFPKSSSTNSTNITTPKSLDERLE